MGRCLTSIALLAALAACETAPNDAGGDLPNAGMASPAAGTGGGPAAGTGGDPAAGTGSEQGGGEPLDPVTLPNTAKFEALQADAEAAGALDTAAALAAYPVHFRADLGYDPAESLGLDTIQGSALSLSDGELEVLGREGLVISTRQQFPTFLRGLAAIYEEHLPLYVSADAILESVHSSYDTILAQIEEGVLIEDLRMLLSGMHERLAGADASKATKADTDVYLCVARGLLEDMAPAPVAGGDRAQIEQLFQGARAADGIDEVTLFGTERMIDFSQFEPRGHYAGNPSMEQYFRAMIWLGRIDLRLIETLSDGSQVFRPEQYEATLLLHALIAPDVARWQRIDDTVRTFVGESDSMVVPEVASLVEDLGGLEAARTANAETVSAAIVAGGYGEQEIASHLMVNQGFVKTLPLNRSFLVFGQRYIVDSHVFSEAVYDRIADRFMPNPLDAAFAALGNNQALGLEQAELAGAPELAGALSRMRVLVDAHEPSFWEANFYNLWMDALRALSPAIDPTATEGAPAIAATEAWGRRILNTQLGSWAELRHDTLLYAKQSYTGIPGCEFPDAYVEPYPAFFQAIVKYAEQGARIVDIAGHVNSDFASVVASYFDNLRTAATRLGEMAQYQARGEQFTAEQMAFINDAVRVELDNTGCVAIEVPDGWFAKLFYQPDKSIEFDPTIADVHTQPADEAGNIVGRILHVGTGYPRLMVTTIDTCSGPRAYAGMVYAYHEQITEDFDRLTDERWAQQLTDGPRPADVPWLSSVLAQ